MLYVMIHTVLRYNHQYVGANYNILARNVRTTTLAKPTDVLEA